MKTKVVEPARFTGRIGANSPKEPEIAAAIRPAAGAATAESPDTTSAAGSVSSSGST